jgi:hypothetical protein
MATMTDGRPKPPDGYASWNSFTRGEYGGSQQTRERVPQIVVAQALKSHFFSVIW